MNNNEPNQNQTDNLPDNSEKASLNTSVTSPSSMDRFIKPSLSVPGPGTSAPSESVDSGKPLQRETSVKEYSLLLAKHAASVAIDNNGADVMILDVCDQTALFDYFVLATGTSRRQLHAISEEIDDVLEKKLGDKRLGIEGYEDSRWIVLDYGNVVIHLFDEETREYYDLESLWGDAVEVPLSDLGLKASSVSAKSDH